MPSLTTLLAFVVMSFYAWRTLTRAAGLLPEAAVELMTHSVVSAA